MKTSFLTAIACGLLSSGTSVLARSTVYMIPNQSELLHGTPDVCLPSFSAFMAHMMGTSASHPMLKLQNEALAGAEAIWSRQSVHSVDIFERNIKANLMVILSGVQSPDAILPGYTPVFHVADNQADSYLAMAEENLERVRASDQGTVAMLTEGNAVIESEGETITYPAGDSMDTVHFFESSFSYLNTDVFDFEQTADLAFASEVEAVRTLISTLASEPMSRLDAIDFSVIEMTGLQTLAHAYGTGSAQYKEAQLVLRDLFEKVVIPGFQNIYANDDRAVTTFVMTPAATHLFAKRGLVDQGSSCHTTYQACENATSSCSGRGACVAVQGCYVCQCKAANNIGEACQYVDVSSDFQLLFWTGVGLVVVTAGVLLFVYKSGDIENGGILMGPQSLPKQD